MSDRLIILLIALVANALLLGPRKFYVRLGLDRPGALASSLARTLERKLNRDRRSGQERRRRGAILAAGALLAALLLGGALQFLTAFGYYGGLAEMAIVALLLGLRQTADRTTTAAQALAAGKLAEARAALPAVWRNAAVLDASGLSRAAVETSAVRFSTHVVMPAFYYLLLGLPGLLAARTLALLEENLTRPRDIFAAATARIFELASYIPSFVASLLTAAAALMLPFAKPWQALRALGQTAPLLDSARRNASVTGATLGIALGGPTSAYAPGAWISDTNTHAAPSSTQRAVWLFWLEGLLLMVVLGVARLF